MKCAAHAPGQPTIAAINVEMSSDLALRCISLRFSPRLVSLNDLCVCMAIRSKFTCRHYTRLGSIPIPIVDGS